MNFLTTKTSTFVTMLISLILGFLMATLINTPSTNEHSPRLSQLENQLHSLEINLSNIDVSLNQLIEQNKADNLIVKLDSPDEETISTANLKNILKEIIHEELNVDTQQNIANNEDTGRAWELISQAQTTEITADFFQSKEINALPPKQKELVISEIIGMMNRGEIDADQFFGIEQ